MYNSIDLQMIPKLIQSFIQVMQKTSPPEENYDWSLVAEEVTAKAPTISHNAVD